MVSYAFPSIYYHYAHSHPFFVKNKFNHLDDKRGHVPESTLHISMFRALPTIDTFYVSCDVQE